MRTLLVNWRSGEKATVSGGWWEAMTSQQAGTRTRQ